MCDSGDPQGGCAYAPNQNPSGCHVVKLATMQIPQPHWTEWGPAVGMRSGDSFTCYNLRAISLENSDNMAKHREV